MSKDEVIELMKSSTCEQEWNDNCDVVKSSQRALDGKDYPDFWFLEIIMSGIARENKESWILS